MFWVQTEQQSCVFTQLVLPHLRTNQQHTGVLCVVSQGLLGNVVLCLLTVFSPLAGTTREHLGLAMALKVPIFIVVSKVDLCSRGTVERTVRQLERVLKQPGCNKVPMVVSNPDDAVTAAQQFAQSAWWG